ncbi:MAG TPA: MotA/TolQ/ExbB proton channel family protein, partial [Planctomycetota bacterium]|nr:MotA/TolQ/ExbB proton channel family protein [Planctomycetota bacterium]
DPYEIIAQGGVILGAIVLLSGLAWYLIARQLFELARETWRVGREADRAARLADAGAIDAAREACGPAPRDLGRRVLLVALEAPRDAIDEERSVRPMLASAESSLRRNLGLTGTLAGALPLLGLLGTVLGMLQTFTALSESQAVRAESVAKGVSQALITTQAGLLAAIPILLVRMWLSAHVDGRLARVAVYAKVAAAAVAGRR